MGKFKAIKVTKENKHALEIQHDMPVDFLEFSSGLYVVSEFGDKQYQAILTKVGLVSRFDLGPELKNGYIELIEKVKK